MHWQFALGRAGALAGDRDGNNPDGNNPDGSLDGNPDGDPVGHLHGGSGVVREAAGVRAIWVAME